VESPSKAKTIISIWKQIHCGSECWTYKDLSNLSCVDIENIFNTNLSEIKGKAPVIKILKTKAKASKEVLIATDPDEKVKQLLIILQMKLKRLMKQFKE